MFPKNIPLYRLDLSGTDPSNKVNQEYYRRSDLEHELIFVIRSGPFYTQSLILTKPTGEVLIEDVDYEIFGIATALTAFVKDKEVAMMIKMTNQTISEWFAEYQVVGHFSILNKDLVNMVNGAVNDDRPVLYKNIRNKPLWFNPELHQHDIRYEIHSFTDLIECIQRIKDVKNILPNPNLVSMEHFETVIFTHIDAYEKMLLSYIAQHNSETAPPYTNSHGLTAKQVNLEKVDNFETATLIDVLNGFRKDLHVTADYLKRVLDYGGKETDDLIKMGTLPLLRYGSNSFIPSPIQGSFEGMGANNFFVGVNIESNGDAVLLGNRNDGRVNGLYFMQNTDKNHALNQWRFTAHRYTHQTAETDGNELRYIIRGSNGKFLMLQGYDKNNVVSYYYAFGNGSFDPAKHKLIKITDSRILADLSGYVTTYILTECFPKRIFFVIRYNQNYCVNNATYRKQGFDLPVDQTSFQGVSFGSSIYGFRFWELDIETNTWSKVNFNYTQPGYTQTITSDMYMPFKTVVTEITADNPRADGRTDLKYGLSMFEYQFSRPITTWYLRDRYDIFLGRYDNENDNLYLKYFYDPYGQDTRSTLFQPIGASSIGLVLKNRKMVNGVLSYDIENRKSLTYVINYDTAPAGGGGMKDWEHGEWNPIGYQGGQSWAWFGEKKLYYYCATGYGAFPVIMSLRDFEGNSVFENYNTFVDKKFNFNGTPSGSSYTYNETNPAGFTINANSTFWVQLDPNDNKSFGSISQTSIQKDGSIGLWFRRHDVLDNNGFPKAPTKVYNLYEALSGNGLKTIGYELNNTCYPITSNPSLIYTTNIFLNIPNNNKALYQKRLVGHSAFTPGMGGVGKNSSANLIYDVEWEIKPDGVGYTFVPTKRYDLSNNIKNVLIPHVEEKLKAQYPNLLYSTVNALGTHQISHVNLPSSTVTNLYIFTFLAFDTPKNATDLNGKYCRIAAVAFTLSGGTAGSNGIITGATTTPVGNVVFRAGLVAAGITINDYNKPDYQFGQSASSSRIYRRNLVQQLSNGNCRVWINFKANYNLTGDSNSPGIDLIVSDKGIIDYTYRHNYWTVSNTSYFHHPYYGILYHGVVTGKPAARATGPSEIGWAFDKDLTSFSSYKQNYDNWVMANSNYLESGFSIYFTTSQEVLLNGKSYTIGTSIVDLYTITPNPQNKTFYIYLDYDGAGAYYNITENTYAETASRGLISIVKTNDDSIIEIENFNVFTMNSIRIFAIKHGSVIPSATGSIDEIGQLNGWIIENNDD